MASRQVHLAYCAVMVSRRCKFSKSSSHSVPHTSFSVQIEVDICTIH